MSGEFFGQNPEAIGRLDRLWIEAAKSLTAELIGEDWSRADIIRAVSFAASVHTLIRFRCFYDAEGAPFSVQLGDAISRWAEADAIRMTGILHVCELVGRVQPESKNGW